MSNATISTNAQREVLKTIFNANVRDNLFAEDGQSFEFTDIFAPGYRDLKQAAYELVDLKLASSVLSGGYSFTVTLNARGWALTKFLMG